jgi:predicted nucleic acid-binding protein
LIVADTNLVAYLLMNGRYSALAEKVFAKDPRWAAPLLWRSEFQSVLLKCVREGRFGTTDAMQIAGAAEILFAGNEYVMGASDPEVLRIAVEVPGCSAYDAEFVALARELGLPLVTADERLLKAFPGTAVAPELFATT